MAIKVMTPILGARLDKVRESADGPEHRLGDTVIVSNVSGDGGTFNRVAIYVKALNTIGPSAAVAIDASAGASASAGGYISLADTTALAGDFIWARSSAPIA